MSLRFSPPRNRSLLELEVRPEDVAEAALLRERPLLELDRQDDVDAGNVTPSRASQAPRTP